MSKKIKLNNALAKRFTRTKAKKKSKIISCRFLIVCEGEKTEPHYFKSFDGLDHENFVYDIEIKGEGKNTLSLVNKTIELKDKATIPYDSVWVVFDKDSFSPHQFNRAIAKAKSKGIQVAWSNEAFELWYLYHFKDTVPRMSRQDYPKAIESEINKKIKNKKFSYTKNDPNMHQLLSQHGSQEKAIIQAQKQHEEYSDTRYADHNPCTTVYLLVNQLLNKDEVLKAEVMRKINE